MTEKTRLQRELGDVAGAEISEFIVRNRRSDLDWLAIRAGMHPFDDLAGLVSNEKRRIVSVGIAEKLKLESQKLKDAIKLVRSEVSRNELLKQAREYSAKQPPRFRGDNAILEMSEHMIAGSLHQTDFENEVFHSKLDQIEPTIAKKPIVGAPRKVSRDAFWIDLLKWWHHWDSSVFESQVNEDGSIEEVYRRDESSWTKLEIDDDVLEFIQLVSRHTYGQRNKLALGTIKNRMHKLLSGR